ncbi:MAG: phytanoyl-CoA dioxygenase family protein [Myxococcaceae bacterium]|nr:phytanoyl-CoA dioxygenase family protein [Myxococcaceae bacterium]MCI0669753.1 phytanoyl-CoA dioxygenase family protein [Myxococcaceae bacterium]
MPTVSFQLDDARLSWDIEGEVVSGADEVLLDHDDDLTARAPWSERGFTVAPSLPHEELAALRQGVTRMIAGILAETGAPTEGFTLERYHTFIAADARRHGHVVERIRDGFPLHRFPIDGERLTRRISEICGVPLQTTYANGSPGLFCLRLVRPLSTDNNPPHRDVWLDHLRHAINIYVPLAGSDARTSLPLVPGSHRWSEADIQRTASGARINGWAYTVPSVVGASRPIRMVRPNPGPEEVLVFSPYLIHGGAKNFSEDLTRASLEMRFWRKKT